jgi:hypothetical protein
MQRAMEAVLVKSIPASTSFPHTINAPTPRFINKFLNAFNEPGCCPQPEIPRKCWCHLRKSAAKFSQGDLMLCLSVPIHPHSLSVSVVIKDIVQ